MPNERNGLTHLTGTKEGFDMRLKTTGRSAVAAMIDVARHEEFGPVPLPDIVSRQQVSLSHLEQIFRLLRRHDLVISVRGPGGGYKLNPNNPAISVADIIDAVENTQKEVTTQPTSPAQAIAQDLWDSMDAKAFDFLQSVKLRSLMLEQLPKGIQK
jgi:Rrf2 family transcriptional regulator, iron-sulfur cluster assembly transcription factor